MTWTSTTRATDRPEDESKNGGTPTPTLVGVGCETGTVTAGAPFSGMNRTATPAVAGASPAPEIVNDVNGAADVALSFVRCSAAEGAVGGGVDVAPVGVYISSVPVAPAAVTPPAAYIDPPIVEAIRPLAVTAGAGPLDQVFVAGS
jgi:hypothetical protein